MPLEFRPAAAQRVLVNTAATLTSYKLDQYGEIANPGATTVTVTRADGTVVATGAATTEDATTYQLSYTLAAANNTQLDWLTAVWTDAGDSTTWTTYHEIVGGFYASVAEVRERDTNLRDTNAYPPATIRAILSEIETAFEQECGRAFVPRYKRVRVSGTANPSLLLPDVDIRTVRTGRDYSDYQTYTAFTATELANLDWYTNGALTRIDGAYWYAGTGNYILEYEYGMDRPPADVKAAAIRWLRSVLNANKTGIPDRATSFSVADGGSYSLLTPGRNGAVTGIPDVDLVIERYRVKRFVVGV
jgi:hypothetical protein